MNSQTNADMNIPDTIFTRDEVLAFIAADRQSVSRATPTDGMLETEIQPRPLSYPLSDYHRAMSEGPLHFTWTDKPHRLVYDLIAAVKHYATAEAPPVAVEATKAVALTEKQPEGEWQLRCRRAGCLNATACKRTRRGTK